MKYEEIKEIVKKVVSLPKADVLFLDEIMDETQKALGQDFANDFFYTGEIWIDHETGEECPITKPTSRLLEMAILEIAESKGYVRGNEDYFGFNPEQDFSNILLSKKRAAKKPYIKWPKGKFTEIPNGVEREQLIATIIEGIDVEIPVNVKKLEAQIREAMLQKTGYLYTWNVLHGWEVLISPYTQRVFLMKVIMYAAEWTLYRRTGLKEIPTTDPYCTIVVD